MQPIIVAGHKANLTVRGGNAKYLVICQCPSKCNGTADVIIERVPVTTDAIVVDTTTGLISAEAQAWMSESGIAFTWMRRGKIIARSEHLPDADIWHAQLGYAHGCRTGITQRLIRLKLDGQAANAKLMRRPDLAEQIMTIADKHDDWCEANDGNLDASWDMHRIHEANGAKAYYQAWTNVHVPFLPDHMRRVPPRWLTYTSRQSDAMPGKHKSHRNASDPVNAMINYAHQCAYRLAEQACHAVGLSPFIACSHTRKYRRDRDGLIIKPLMAFDLSEAIQPYADRVVLDLLDYGQGQIGYLKRTDFLELPDLRYSHLELPPGTVRIESADLRRRILTGVQAHRDDMIDIAVWVRRQLGVKRRHRIRTELEDI